MRQSVAKCAKVLQSVQIEIRRVPIDNQRVPNYGEVLVMNSQRMSIVSQGAGKCSKVRQNLQIVNQSVPIDSQSAAKCGKVCQNAAKSGYEMNYGAVMMRL